MNKWKSRLSPEVKQILKDIKNLDKINKDGSFLSNNNGIPETHLSVLEKAYFTAVHTQLLLIHTSIEHWMNQGSPMRKEKSACDNTSDTRSMV